MNLKFWNRRNETGSIAVEETSVLTKEPCIATEDDGFAKEYERVAEKLGVLARPNNSWHHLAKALADLGITVFNSEKISAYMAAQIRKADKDGHTTGSYWQTASLCLDENARQANSNVTSSLATSLYPGRIDAALGQLAAYLPYRQYSKPVPLPVLLTVEKIEDALPGECEFTIHSLKADPFLSVHLKADPERKGFFIERWDEPSFRA